MSPVLPATAAILVGGEGRRLGGTAKHRLRLPDGRTVLERLVALLSAEVGPVSLVARPGFADPDFAHLPLRTDAYADRGAAAGIHAALAAAPPGWVFLASCDLPLLDAPAVRALAAVAAETPRADVVLARTGAHLQPLAAFWHTRTTALLAARLAEAPGPAHGLHRLVGALSARIVEGLPESAFTNLNRPEDLAALGVVR